MNARQTRPPQLNTRDNDRPRRSFIKSLWRDRELLWQLSKRAVEARYRGSLFGRAWSLITPLLMLAVYTFVFSSVFKARWGDLQESGPLAFAANLFAGLIVFGVFSDTFNQSPDLMIRNRNLVTKVVFPLELLSGSTVASALFNGLTGAAILFSFQAANGVAFHLGGAPGAQIGPHASMLWLPVVWTPLILGCLAISWLTSALGVYLRDLGQLTGVATNLLLFLSTVFYPLSALPSRWQPILGVNPLVWIIEQTRRVCIAGDTPSFTYIIAGTSIGLIACEVCFRAFAKARKGFSDVL